MWLCVCMCLTEAKGIIASYGVLYPSEHSLPHDRAASVSSNSSTPKRTKTSCYKLQYLVAMHTGVQQVLPWNFSCWIESHATYFNCFPLIMHFTWSWCNICFYLKYLPMSLIIYVWYNLMQGGPIFFLRSRMVFPLDSRTRKHLCHKFLKTNSHFSLFLILIQKWQITIVTNTLKH
jgi:hypothetical protein